MKAVKICAAIFSMLMLFSIVSGCDDSSPMDEYRQWLADETDTYVNLYKVAYNQVYTLQSSEHPCTKGHKTDEAATFHAVLTNLNSYYKQYRDDVNKKMGQHAIEDTPCKNLLAVIDNLSNPFLTMEKVNKCGSMKAAKAKEQFYLQPPTEAFVSIKQLRESINK